MRRRHAEQSLADPGVLQTITEMDDNKAKTTVYGIWASRIFVKLDKRLFVRS